MRTFSFLLSILAVVSLSSCGQSSDKEIPAVTEASDTVTETTAEQTEQAASPEEPQMTGEMFIAFERFRKVMLEGSCAELAQQCVLPLRGACAADILDPSDEYLGDIPVSKETLLKNCNFLNEIELAVLKKRTSLESNTSVSDESCEYVDRFYVDENGEFSWSVGCLHLINQEIGEYNKIFVFRRVDGKFRLYKIDCAE